MAIVPLVLSGCAANLVPPATPTTAGEELISFETAPGPFCGRCHTVRVTASSSGQVWIEHGYWVDPHPDRRGYHDWRVERRVESVAPERFAAFRAGLQPYRPVSDLIMGGQPLCATFWTDIDEVHIQWRGGGPDARLIFNFGCDPQTRRTTADALRAAPDALGIRNLRLPYGQWVATTPQ